MGSTFTTNGGIEKIGLGEQAGSWGTTTNTNFDIIDRLINGVGDLTLSGTSSTLTTSDGALSNGMFKVLVLGGSPSGTHTITIAPNDADKLYFVKNGTSQSVIFSQGSGANATITAGKGAIIFADGAGSGAAVTDLTALFINSQALDGVTIDNSVIGGSTPAAITGTTIVGTTITANTSILPDTSGGADIGSTSAEFGDIYIADDKKIHFGNDQDATIEYDEDGTDKLVITGDVTFADGTTDVDIASHDTSNGLKLGGTLVTATANELNIMDGVTATKDELNIMDGVTATTTELNHTDGVTSNIQTQLDDKHSAVGQGLQEDSATTVAMKNSWMSTSSAVFSFSGNFTNTRSYPVFVCGRTNTGSGGSFTFTVNNGSGGSETIDQRDGDSGTHDFFAMVLPVGGSVTCGVAMLGSGIELRPG
tara:strand:- start:123 stop:1388 length:1266 start_codon:yes stop_codon:yes gene_type:complete